MLTVEPDEHTEAYFATQGPVIGERAIGCVYISYGTGVKYALLRASAATSNISRLFDASASIRRTFATIGEASRALGVFLDREEHTGDDVAYELVFPERRRVHIDYAAFEEPWHDPWSHVDEFCSRLLAAES